MPTRGTNRESCSQCDGVLWPTPVIELVPAPDGGMPRLRAVYVCAGHRHRSWRWADTGKPLRPLDPADERTTPRDGLGDGDEAGEAPGEFTFPRTTTAPLALAWTAETTACTGDCPPDLAGRFFVALAAAEVLGVTLWMATLAEVLDTLWIFLPVTLIPLVATSWRSLRTACQVIAATMIPLCLLGALLGWVLVLPAALVLLLAAGVARPMHHVDETPTCRDPDRSGHRMSGRG